MPVRRMCNVCAPRCVQSQCCTHIFLHMQLQIVVGITKHDKHQKLLGFKPRPNGTPFFSETIWQQSIKHHSLANSKLTACAKFGMNPKAKILNKERQNLERALHDRIQSCAGAAQCQKLTRPAHPGHRSSRARRGCVPSALPLVLRDRCLALKGGLRFVVRGKTHVQCMCTALCAPAHD